MSTLPPNTPPLPADAYRELAGLLMLLAGVAGLVTIAFIVRPLLGATVLSSLSVAGGLVLTIRRR